MFHSFPLGGQCNWLELSMVITLTIWIFQNIIIIFIKMSYASLRMTKIYSNVRRYLIESRRKHTSQTIIYPKPNANPKIKRNWSTWIRSLFLPSQRLCACNFETKSWRRNKENTTLHIHLAVQICNVCNNMIWPKKKTKQRWSVLLNPMTKTFIFCCHCDILLFNTSNVFFSEMHGKYGVIEWNHNACQEIEIHCVKEWNETMRT